MALIPQNTLLGLPDELIEMIVRRATRSPTTIDTEALKRSRVMKWVGRKGDLLSPLRANAQLWKMARYEFYNTNTFYVRSNMLQHSFVPGHAAFLTHDDRTERTHIKHLQIELPFTFAADWVDLDIDPMQGDEFYSVLPNTASLYPNLETSTVVMMHDSSKGESWIQELNGVQVDPQAAYVAEIRWSVSNALMALDESQSPALTRKYFQLLQTPSATPASTCEFDGREVTHCDSMAWMLMDLPNGEVRLT